MYTKLLLLIAISIVISSSVASDNHNLKIANRSEKNIEANMVATPSQQQTNNNLPFGIDWSDIPHQDQAGHGHSHSNDDDGKSHHFHFEHFAHSRRNRILSIVGKVILLVTFISSLISGFYLWQG